MNPLLVAGGISLANKLFGGHGSNQAELPKDLQPMRANQIALLNYLTGFSPMPAMMGGPIPPMPHNPAAQIRWMGQYGAAAKQRQAAGVPGSAKAGWGATPGATAGAPNPYGAYNYASGGMVYGPGGPKDDRIPAWLSNGEGVLTTEAVHAMGGPPIVHFLNLLAAMQQPSPVPHGAQHFADGGVVGGQPEWIQALLQRQAHYAYGPAGVPTGTAPGGTMSSGASGMPQYFANGGVAGLPAAFAPVSAMFPQVGQRVQQAGGLGSHPSGLASLPFFQRLMQAHQQPQPAGGQPHGTTDPGRTGQMPTLPGTAMPGGAPTPGGAGPSGMGGPPTPDARPKSDAQNRLESYFGPLGVPTTALQRQAVGGMQQFLSSDPYAQARTALNQILGSPGDAFRPDFDRALAQANQTGGRFGSANALMRSQALNDYNSAALKQAIAAAQGVQGLGAQQVNDMTAGYNMGSQYANQLASGQQQALSLLLSQLQTAQGASLNVPTQQQSSGFGQSSQGLSGIGQLLSYLPSPSQQPTAL